MILIVNKEDEIRIQKKIGLHFLLLYNIEDDDDDEYDDDEDEVRELIWNK